MSVRKTDTLVITTIALLAASCATPDYTVHVQATAPHHGTYGLAFTRQYIRAQGDTTITLTHHTTRGQRTAEVQLLHPGQLTLSLYKHTNHPILPKIILIDSKYTTSPLSPIQVSGE